MARLIFRPLDSELILRELVTIGGVSVPLLSRGLTRQLILETMCCDFIQQPAVFGPRKVSQCFATTRTFPVGSALRSLPGLLAAELTALAGPLSHAMVHPLTFNRNNLQKYPASPCGIGRHRDFTSDINFSVIINLSGRRDFRLFRGTDDNEGIALDTTPGTAIFLRAMGFAGCASQHRPEHMVRKVPNHSLAFVLRHSTDPYH